MRLRAMNQSLKMLESPKTPSLLVKLGVVLPRSERNQSRLVVSSAGAVGLVSIED